MSVIKRDDEGNVDVFCCGEWLPCSGFTTTCEHCGSDYNWAGQKLAAREFWGEETGETYADLADL